MHYSIVQWQLVLYVTSLLGANGTHAPVHVRGHEIGIFNKRQTHYFLQSNMFDARKKRQAKIFMVVA